jgi:hypothetical protein
MTDGATAEVEGAEREAVTTGAEDIGEAVLVELSGDVTDVAGSCVVFLAGDAGEDDAAQELCARTATRIMPRAKVPTNQR